MQRSFIAILIVCLLSDNVAAWCIGPRPQIKYRRGIAAATYFVEPNFDAFSRQCIAAGIEAGWGDAGFTASPGSLGSATVSVFRTAGITTLNAATYDEPYPAILYGGSPVTSANIFAPADLASLSDYDCDRIMKVFRHEIGHVLGLGHNTDFSWSIMKQGHTWLPHNGVDLLPLYPNCADIEAAVEAWNFRGPAPGQVGDIGGISGCGPEDYSDSTGCCHPREVLMFAPSVGHLNRRPTIAIESPANNTVYGPWSTITFTPHTLDLDGSVKRVFWAYRSPGGSWTWTPETWSYPFTLVAQNVPPGAYEVKAEAEDTAGLWGFSNVITVQVLAPPSGPGVLPSGQILYPDQSRTSPNGLHSVVYHASNGNFVFYQNGVGILGTGTTVPAGGVLMNPNGALEVYNAYQQRLWTSATDSTQNAGSHFRVSNDGKVAIVRPNGTIVWQWP